MSIALLLFYIFSVVIGAISIAFCAFIYLENRNIYLKYCMFLLFSEFGRGILSIVEIYSKALNSKDILIGTFIINFAMGVLAILEGYMIMLFAYRVADLPLGRLKKSIYLLLFLFMPLNEVFEKFFPEIKSNEIINRVPLIITTVIVSYLLFLVFTGIKKAKSSDGRLIAKLILAAGGFSLLFIQGLRFIFGEEKMNEYGYIDHHISYFVVSIICLIFAARFYLIKIEIKRETENNETIKIEENKTEVLSTDNDKSPVSDIDSYPLTQREKEIVGLIMDGCTNQEIADKLFISLSTVKTHIYNVYQKMDVKNRTELQYRLKKNI